jgi:hypothetical protein
MLTGQTIGQIHPDHAEPHTKDDPLVFMTMSVTASHDQQRLRRRRLAAATPQPKLVRHE